MSVTIDPPSSLPVDHLSVSSLKLLSQCPIRWKRRYIDREYERPSGKMLLGSAAGASEAQHFSRLIDGDPGLSVEEVLDEFSDEWEERIAREDVDFGRDTPGQLKDSAASALSVYHTVYVPSIRPVSVEREFRLSWPGLDWDLTGFLDREDEDGSIADLKMKGRRMSERDAHSDLQATVYLAARRAEGNPASLFRFDTMIRGVKVPTAEVVPTTRSEDQLDALTDRVFALARELEWRAENEVWTGAAPGLFKPVSDVCSGCGFTDCRWRLA